MCKINKKITFFCALVFLLCLSLSFLKISVAEKAYAAQGEYLIDADQLSFYGSTEKGQADVNNFLNEGTENNIIQSYVNKDNPSVKLVASSYADKIYGGDNDAVRIEIRLLYNCWPDTGYGGFSDDVSYVALEVYNSADTSFETPIASTEQYGSMGNFVRTIQIAPEKVCNHRGKLQDFVLRVKSDATSWASAIIVDYVKIVFEEKNILLGGECVTGENPQGITDENVTWTKAQGYADTYLDPNNYGGFYAYVDNPALVELRKEQFSDVACVTETDGTETLLLKNLVFALDVGNISVDEYEQFEMDILLADKRAKGDHTLYLYGSDTQRFLDESGKPVGYVSSVTVESYEQGFHNKFVVEKEDLHKLANEEGVISNLYVLYYGNTLDSEEETVGLRNGSQIWINKVQFLTQDEIEQPKVGTEYAQYDISDIFPVGQSVTLENKADESGKVVSIAALKDKSVGELSFGLTMARGDTVGFLFNGKGLGKSNEHTNGGILFCVSDNDLKISAHKNGTETKSVSITTEIDFTETKEIKIECIPYFINLTQAGYYCAVWVGEDKLLDEYFANDCLDIGTAFHICYEAQADDFSVTLASSKTEGITAAKDLMSVQIRSEEIVYSLDKTDIPLALSWYNTGFDQLSDVEAVGEIVTVNQETKRIQFYDNGEVKVKYSVTNAFGTFESNELSLSCDEVVTMPTVQDDEASDETSDGEGCSNALTSLPVVICGLASCVFAVARKKSSRKE